MEDNKNKSQTTVKDPERREALKKLGALGIAVATAPAMITLLEATQASAQSGPPPISEIPN